MPPTRTNAGRLALTAALFAISIAGVWFAVAGAGKVGAHAVQLSSVPAPNAQLAESPAAISIEFSEPLEPAVTTVQLWDATPAELPLGALSYPASESLVVEVPQVLETGIYTVIWRNLSTIDGHTWAGSFAFIVLGPNGEIPEGSVPAELQNLAQPPANSPRTLDTAARWLVLLGSAVMFGGTAYVLLVALPAARRLSGDSSQALRGISINVIVVSTAIAVFLVLQGSLIQLLTQADRLGGLGNVDELLTDTRFGKYLIARQVLLFITLLSAGLVWRARDAWLKPALAVLLVAAFSVQFTQSMVSHAAGADGAFWKVGADVLHYTAAALWIGGLIHIGLAMPRWRDELKDAPRTLFAAESFRRYSVLAAFSVVVLMVSGVLGAFAQFASFGQLFDTSYGWSLVAKMGVMLPLLAVAGLNAFILQPRTVDAGLRIAGGAAGDGGSAALSAQRLQGMLVNTVRAEAVLGIVVLVAAGVLSQLEPARAEAEVEAASTGASVGVDPSIEERGYFLEANQVGGLVVSLKIEPARVGVNNFEVGLGSEFGAVGEVLLVRLDIEHADPEIGGSRLELPLSGSAKYAMDASNLSLPGEYEISAVVRRRGEDDVIADYTVAIGTAAEIAESSIWDWPFEGRRSTGAVIALIVGAVGLAATAGWQLRNVRPLS